MYKSGLWKKEIEHIIKFSLFLQQIFITFNENTFKSQQNTLIIMFFRRRPLILFYWFREIFDKLFDKLSRNVDDSSSSHLLINDRNWKRDWPLLNTPFNLYFKRKFINLLRNPQKYYEYFTYPYYNIKLKMYCMYCICIIFLGCRIKNNYLSLFTLSYKICT